MASTAVTGRNLEYDIKQMFKEAGWDCIRGAGSKGEVFSFKTDLLFTRTRTRYTDQVFMEIRSYEEQDGSVSDLVSVQCKRKKK